MQQQGEQVNIMGRGQDSSNAVFTFEYVLKMIKPALTQVITLRQRAHSCG